MLSPSSIALVKSTVPVLEAHGELLTRHFYKRMFEKNPEVAPFFNQTNQTSGAQSKALAAAVCAYAANIDNLGALGGAVELIAQKHVSLQIQAEHYPIVGENLLASIKEVLGDAATDELIAAWGEAYGLLAKILIGRENEIYDQQQEAPGGWSGFKPFRVLRKEQESSVITSFYLEPADGEAVPEFKPGQYITLRVPSPCGHSTMRNYSLSDTPGQAHFRISVKREVGNDAATHDGFVSNFLHEGVSVGSTLEVGPPCGDFFLDLSESGSRPLVLLSAGVGITPVLSMLHSVLATASDRPIYFVHAAQNGQTHAFRENILALASEHHNLTVHYRYSAPTDEDRAQGYCHSEGLIDGALLESLVSDNNAEYYFCGPKPFMISLYQQLMEWNIPKNQVHLEFFGPRQALEQSKKTVCPI